MTIQANQGFGVSVFGAVSGGGGGSTSPGGSSGQIQYNASGSFAGMAGTSWDNTNRALTLTGATVTTSQPVLNLSQTWNAAGVTFTGLQFNAAGASGTNSASGSLLLDLQTGGVSQLYVTKSGSFYVNQKASFGGNTTIGENGSGHIVTRSAGILGFTSTTSGASVPDTIISRAAAASIRLGDADAAAPVAQTFKVQGVVSGTSNTAGANFTIQGSQSTGTGAGGSIIFQVAPAGSSGTAQNAYATALTLNSAQQAVFGTNGTAALPSLAWATDVTTGFYKSSTTIVDLSVAGAQAFRFSTNGFFFTTSVGRIELSSAGAYAFASGTAGSSTTDVYLYRDAANTLALRNGTNAQLLRVYSTYTDASNNAFAYIGAGVTSAGAANANILSIGSNRNGTSGNDLTGFEIRVNGTTRLDYNISLGSQWTFVGDIKGASFLGNGQSGVGYRTGAGGAVTQITSRTTGVTLNNICGQITLVSAAGTTSWQSFTVSNTRVAATDTIIVNQDSGTDLYQIFVTNVAANSFQITFATTGGTTTEQPVFGFSVIKSVAS